MTNASPVACSESIAAREAILQDPVYEPQHYSNGPAVAPHPKRSGVASIASTSQKGVQFDSRIPYEIWRALGARIAARVEAASWWLGDWMVFGEQRYGRRYREAIDVTGLDYQTLRNYAVVARRFELSRRRDNLSFQHHAEVCALPDDAQEHWLDLAAVNRWSKRELRIRVRGAIRRDGAAEDYHALRLTVDLQREQRWRDAAAHHGCSFEDWVTEALDAAASS